MYPKLSALEDDSRSTMPCPSTGCVSVYCTQCNSCCGLGREDRQAQRPFFQPPPPPSSYESTDESDEDVDEYEEDVPQCSGLRKVRTDLVVNEHLQNEMQWLNEWVKSLENDQSQLVVKKMRESETGYDTSIRQVREASNETSIRECANTLKTLADQMIKLEQEKLLKYSKARESLIEMMMEEFEKISADAKPSCKHAAQERLQTTAKNCGVPNDDQVQVGKALSEDEQCLQFEKECSVKECPKSKRSKSARGSLFRRRTRGESQESSDANKKLTQDASKLSATLRKWEAKERKREKKRLDKLCKILAS